ncbi:TIGR04283 family arsenosugar biosynthesis glycosyltransferase [Gangjinia marincola]|uniref:TIGR04283 family arsenosugar biosynthesis glycosyltransferase n=1 Tax=Gangjinia marincola TaxID=578463 RepID=A0ABN1MHF4_9FLAO
MTISIIIPTYNEAEAIYEQLERIKHHLKEPELTEIILVDGQSTDETPVQIKRFIKNSKVAPFSIKLEHAEKGRAKQLNYGARKATGELLYFLHADTFTFKKFDKKIKTAVANGLDAGCFRLKFDQNHPLLKISEWFTRFNWKICRGGDQSLFVKKNIFNALNGFNEDYTIYEDCEFVNRLYDNGKFRVLPFTVTTSSRRYLKHGMYRLQFHFAVIHAKYWLGYSPTSLKNYYLKHISQ